MIYRIILREAQNYEHLTNLLKGKVTSLNGIFL